VAKQLLFIRRFDPLSTVAPEKRRGVDSRRDLFSIVKEHVDALCRDLVSDDISTVCMYVKARESRTDTIKENREGECVLRTLPFPVL
jgi:hypothetical protein